MDTLPGTAYRLDAHAIKPFPFGVILLNLAASIHLVWFYLAFVHSELNLPLYEQGLERVPFQQRLLLMFPLRWAHNSPHLNALAHWLTNQPAWFPLGVRPEGVAEAVIDLACVILTGLIARSLYQASSRTGLLTAYVYPLTLLMIAATFCLNTMHRLRFVYDLPSMAFFSAGLYLIYFRRALLLIAFLFLLATINRETTLFLLVVCIITRWVDVTSLHQPTSKAATWQRVFDARTTVAVASLAASWILWHVWITHRYLHNPSAAGPRFLLNLGTLLVPASWAQFLCTFAFCWPLCISGRKLVYDRTLRAWFWLLPLWLLFMLRYGLIIEVRIFGELIPYLACIAVLIAEERLRLAVSSAAIPPTMPIQRNA